jgi:hypothetical protein
MIKHEGREKKTITGKKEKMKRSRECELNIIITADINLWSEKLTVGGRAIGWYSILISQGA